MIGAPEESLQRIRGNDISFIFQEPMTSLNPLHTIEKQLGESLSVHQGLRGTPLQDRIVELLEKVGIPDPVMRLKSLSTSAVRWAKAAGDDRNGLGQ
jgi:microcin C transport system ATP-binding protein